MYRLQLNHSHGGQESMMVCLFFSCLYMSVSNFASFIFFIYAVDSGPNM